MMNTIPLDYGHHYEDELNAKAWTIFELKTKVAKLENEITALRFDIKLLEVHRR
ncbi:MAG: hypothetical protein K0U66_00620 [Gammaproteobacteria bacterium]|nr:hypothetical protein [Gammaproteobacteria bacterium]